MNKKILHLDPDDAESPEQPEVWTCVCGVISISGTYEVRFEFLDVYITDARTRKSYQKEGYTLCPVAEDYITLDIINYTDL